MTGCRIARIRFKESGKTLEIFPDRRKDAGADFFLRALEMARGEDVTEAAYVLYTKNNGTLQSYKIFEDGGSTAQLLGMLMGLINDISVRWRENND